jgi:aminoglycoside 3-N-acetyltransferase
MPSYRDLAQAFKELELGSHSRVLLHASLSVLPPIPGGAETIIGALLSTCELLVTPAFTLRSMVTPGVGPADNALEYGASENPNLEAEIYTPDLPADEGPGSVPEALREYQGAFRSKHPLLSFVGVNVEDVLQTQTLEDPWAPVAWLAEYDADVVLMGVDHTANIGLHYAEMKAGRRQFVRWALTLDGVLECPGFPGCAAGFQDIAPRLEGIGQKLQLDESIIEVIPLRDMINIAVGWIHEDPRALLCDREGCPCCAAVRASVRVDG